MGGDEVQAGSKKLRTSGRGWGLDVNHVLSRKKQTAEFFLLSFPLRISSVASPHATRALVLSHRHTSDHAEGEIHGLEKISSLIVSHLRIMIRRAWVKNPPVES